MVNLATVRPCKGSSGTEVLPEEELLLDLVECASLYPSGRMLVHTDDLELARERALLVLTHAGVE